MDVTWPIYLGGNAMADSSASIIIAVRCGGHEPTFIRVYAGPGELPLDTYRRVCEAHEPGDALPDYVSASGYPGVAA